MKAIVQDAYGTPDVLALRDVDRPVVGDDEVLLRVHAAGLHMGDWHFMAGLPYLIRMASGLRAPRAQVRGTDVAGRVEAVGKGVTQFQPGDEVFGTVTGVCSTTKVDLARSIGADEVIDYTRDDFAKGGRRYDLILDIAGNRALSHLRRALAPRGTLVIVGGEGGGPWFGGIDRQLRAQMLSLFVGQRLGTFIAKANGGDLVALKELIEAGKVTPLIDRTYPLSEVPQAIRYLEKGHARGKIVITV